MDRQGFEMYSINRMNRRRQECGLRVFVDHNINPRHIYAVSYHSPTAIIILVPLEGWKGFQGFTQNLVEEPSLILHPDHGITSRTRCN